MAGQALLVKLLITLEPHGIFCSNFVYSCILTLSSHWYEKRDEAPPSISLAGRAILVKMLIALEPGNAFDSNFEYFILCIFFYFFFIFFNFCLFLLFFFCLFFSFKLFSFFWGEGGAFLSYPFFGILM